MFESYLKPILLARVYDLAIQTPLDFAPLLSERLGNRIALKREDEQAVFSFKVRGAYNKMVKLPPGVLARGIVTSSAGNHGQGVALAAQKLGARAVIVMPVTTPQIKLEAVRRLDAEIVLHGDTYDEAHAKARELEREQQLTFVHPYDDPDVIAGQGTIGIEILRQHPEPLEAVFVPVGGGGLIAGIGAAIKSLRPEVKIIGVEPEEAASLALSLKRGERTPLERIGRFADGVAVKQVGATNFALAQEVVDEMVLVSTDEICAAVKEIFEDRRCVLEPSGALAYAGLKKYVHAHSLRDRSLIAVASGANVNFDTLRYISERAEIGEKRETIFAIIVPERPGSFREFCRVMGSRSITEFNYRFAEFDKAVVYVGVKVEGPQEGREVQDLLRQNGYEVLDLTDNETAKLHIRHMVGGRALGVEDEVLVSFSFPERSGALLEFLERMSLPWNISLFHYRNHGSDYGRVLAGFQVPEPERPEFVAFMKQLDFDATIETENPACRLFLS